MHPSDLPGAARYRVLVVSAHYWLLFVALFVSDLFAMTWAGGDPRH